jgi:outer membrane lipoprotein
MRFAALATLVVLVGGCASPPRPLRGECAATLPDEARSAAREGELVRWGGTLVAATPSANETCFEILGRELNESARPRTTADVSAGRFLACRDGFYDPAIFAPDREVTVTGRIAGYETRRIGEYDYRYPRVAADVVYLWPERREVDVYRHAPLWPVYRPFWWGGYYGPVRVVVPRSAPAPKPDTR